MADKHPYMSGSAGLVQAVNHFRKSFPAQVSADTLKKLGIAPNNETYVINILRFIDVLNNEGKKTDKASTVFAKHNDEDFQKALSEMVEDSYKDLFSFHSKDSWDLSTDQLISFFRETDHTSAIVGKRQAGTFQTLAALCGHGEVPAQKSSSPTGRTKAKTTPTKTTKTTKKTSPDVKIDEAGIGKAPRDIGLTVRVEINLPAVADQETYDRIFKSIRENLLNVK